MNFLQKSTLSGSQVKDLSDEMTENTSKPDKMHAAISLQRKNLQAKVKLLKRRLKRENSDRRFILNSATNADSGFSKSSKNSTEFVSEKSASLIVIDSGFTEKSTNSSNFPLDSEIPCGLIPTKIPDGVSVKSVYYELEDGIIYKKITTYENSNLSKSLLKVSNNVSKKSVRFFEPDTDDAEKSSTENSPSPKPVTSNILSGFDWRDLITENKFEVLADLSDTEF